MEAWANPQTAVARLEALGAGSIVETKLLDDVYLSVGSTLPIHENFDKVKT